MASETMKTALMEELQNLGNQGVKFYLGGNEVHPEESLVSLLLADEGCTYMRNYVFHEEKVVKVEFDKIIL